MTAIAPRPGTMPVSDDYEGEESRFAIYTVRVEDPVQLGGRKDDRARRRIAETSLDGIGVCLQMLRDEDEIGDNSRIGLFDRLDRRWLVNPFARGDLR